MDRGNWAPFAAPKSLVFYSTYQFRYGALGHLLSLENALAAALDFVLAVAKSPLYPPH